MLNIYPFYVRYCRENNINFLDQNSLKMILTAKANSEFIGGSQKGRAMTYTDKYFNSCHQFSFRKNGDVITIADVEINL